jgi:hypothetical protein
MCRTGLESRGNFYQAFPDLPPAQSPWEEYQEYLARTSILIPIMLILYVRLPRVIKETVLFDWAWYRRTKQSYQ